MKELDLTVLGYEGPLLRAYLAAMRRAGYRPARLLLMVLTRHAGSGRAVGRWLPDAWRRRYATRVQDCVLNHHPRQIAARYPEIVASMVGALQRDCPQVGDIAREIRTRSFEFSRYASEVIPTAVSGLADPDLVTALRHNAGSTVLYSGGGRVTAALLSGDRRWLHVHPGRLPWVRGSDGLLWSLLVRGHPSMSCFIMEPGIDTGAVVSCRDYVAPQVEIASGQRPDDLTLYRALFSVYDPLLRAAFLVQAVLQPHAHDLAALPATVQDPDQGQTYYFMHPALRAEALRRLFRSTRTVRAARPAVMGPPAGRVAATTR